MAKQKKTLTPAARRALAYCAITGFWPDGIHRPTRNAARNHVEIDDSDRLRMYAPTEAAAEHYKTSGMWQAHAALLEAGFKYRSFDRRVLIYWRDDEQAELDKRGDFVAFRWSDWERQDRVTIEADAHGPAKKIAERVRFVAGELAAARGNQRWDEATARASFEARYTGASWTIDAQLWARYEQRWPKIGRLTARVLGEKRAIIGNLERDRVDGVRAALRMLPLAELIGNSAKLSEEADRFRAMGVPVPAAETSWTTNDAGQFYRTFDYKGAQITAIAERRHGADLFTADLFRGRSNKPVATGLGADPDEATATALGAL